jgi:hypothetical protein
VADPLSWFLIESGWQVVDAAGAEVGTVAEVRGDESEDIFDGLTVAKNVLDKPTYVAAEIVGPITEGRVELTISSEEFAAL